MPAARGWGGAGRGQPWKGAEEAETALPEAKKETPSDPWWQIRLIHAQKYPKRR
ncbi:hypothetical protein ABT093_23895 [Kitasatospora sp. NPDC002551]|uniref:hypothetical protein n=1 Tax=Kitasatospora sp. NPDC002551 TaxID=3154539 RepID=UPI003319B6A8